MACALVVLVLCSWWVIPVATAQSTYVVNATGDAGDATPSDGLCETGSGDCTFRAAIEQANADAARDVIDFSDVPTNTNGQAVLLLQSEIIVTDPVEILGRTAPGYVEGGPPVVVLDGSDLTTAGADGLEVGASDVVIEALAIVDFPDDGIDLRGGTGNRVSFCYVGVDVDGVTPRSNGDNGVAVAGTGHLIGGDGTVGGGNVISGNAGNGIGTDGPDVQMRVGDNLIGLDASGSQPLGNSGAGVGVFSGSDSEIGFVDDSGTPHGNVISANASAGIHLSSDQHVVLANVIGLSVDETTAIPNPTGIFLESSANTIGPDSRGDASNVIAGNTSQAIRVGRGGQTSSNGNVIQNNFVGVTRAGTPVANAIGIDVEFGSDNVIDGNVIGGNADALIIDANGVRNDVIGNFVGVTPSGADVGNTSRGITVVAAPVDAADAVRIGGPGAGEANVIGFNAAYGVSVNGARNVVVGNYVGTDASGADLGNDGPGIRVAADDVRIGGAGAGNVVGFNAGPGLLVTDASNTVVKGNYVGTNPAGDALGNHEAGLRIRAQGGQTLTGTIVGYDADASLPDAPTPDAGGEGNVFAYNGASGIEVDGAGTATGHTIRGNSIAFNAVLGVNLDGDGATPNDPDDADAGPNNLQNTPVFDPAQTTFDASTGTVELRYRVDCTPANCDYGTSGLRIDVYRTPDDGTAQGQVFLGSLFYPEANAGAFVDASLSPPSGVTVTETDEITAIATDASGNSSEFSDTPGELPVDIVDFSAQANGSSVTLRWRTATEANNAGFVVQHEVDGAFADASPLIEGAGTSTRPRAYDHTIDDLSSGTHTFRLRQQDLDGSVTFTAPLDVKIDMRGRYQLAAFPNPFRDRATVQIAVRESQPVTVEVYNTLGQRVRTLYRDTPSAAQTVEVALQARDLSSGLYIVRMQGESFTTTQTLTLVR